MGTPATLSRLLTERASGSSYVCEMSLTWSAKPDVFQLRTQSVHEWDHAWHPRPCLQRLSSCSCGNGRASRPETSDEVDTSLAMLTLVSMLSIASTTQSAPSSHASHSSPFLQRPTCTSILDVSAWLKLDLLSPRSDLLEELLSRNYFWSSYIFQSRTCMSVER